MQQQTLVPKPPHENWNTSVF